METLIGTYIFICLLFLFLCLSKPLDIQYNKPNLFFVVATFTILLFVHCAVEFNSVEDLWSYESRFQEAAKMDLNDFNVTQLERSIKKINLVPLLRGML